MKKGGDQNKRIKVRKCIGRRKSLKVQKVYQKLQEGIFLVGFTDELFEQVSKLITYGQLEPASSLAKYLHVSTLPSFPQGTKKSPRPLRLL